MSAACTGRAAPSPSAQTPAAKANFANVCILSAPRRMTAGLEEPGAAELERVRGGFLQFRQRMFRLVATRLHPSAPRGAQRLGSPRFAVSLHVLVASLRLHRVS